MYKLKTRKGFASGHHRYDVYCVDKLICSFVTKIDAEEYVRFKNSQQKE